ncbi:hypothetical protein GCM10025876_06180 [Demequina litorisediminis]|uniref:Uncharacterized protein n=1 Tax=Demequina litorisediminis TaxID=1849022 RepID=A0ABQ6I9W2_9MICO|nr:hypothetical protein GCM10025876_06180 [Demequina litorisediminis]
MMSLAGGDDDEIATQPPVHGKGQGDADDERQVAEGSRMHREQQHRRTAHQRRRGQPQGIPAAPRPGRCGAGGLEGIGHARQHATSRAPSPRPHRPFGPRL